jgi:tetratricopeptide (TPR) repeat protein
MDCRKDYYKTLGVSPQANFQALKRAYYRRAKECHPDRFQGCPLKEEEFKQLVEAFDVLSDPVQRQHYNSRFLDAPPELPAGNELAPFRFASAPIMDSAVDDTLEELIVGNDPPRRTTLQNLMLDLGRTEKFCLFREAKTYFYRGHIHRACRLLQKAVDASPNNILYRYYLGKCYCLLRHWKKGASQYESALRLGLQRQPPLVLQRIRLELDRLRQQHGGLLSRWKSFFKKDEFILEASPEEEMRSQLERQMEKHLRQHLHGRALLGGGPPKPKREPKKLK